MYQNQYNTLAVGVGYIGGREPSEKADAVALWHGDAVQLG